MSHNLTPMQVCERIIGKPGEIGRAIGYNEKAAFHWRHERAGRDAGDLPSARVMRALLAHSDANNLGLTAEHLIFGATATEVDLILAARDQRGIDLLQPEAPVFATRREAAA